MEESIVISITESSLCHFNRFLHPLRTFREPNDIAAVTAYGHHSPNNPLRRPASSAIAR